jgi:hypothetical protein
MRLAGRPVGAYASIGRRLMSQASRSRAAYLGSIAATGSSERLLLAELAVGRLPVNPPATRR